MIATAFLCAFEIQDYFFNLSAPETGDFTDKNPYAEVKVVPPEYVKTIGSNATYYMTRSSWPGFNVTKMVNSETGKIDPVDPIQKGIRPAVNLKSSTLVAGPYTDPNDGESYYTLVDGNYQGVATLESPEMSAGQAVNVTFEIMKGNGSIDTEYQELANVTISGYSPAPDGTIGTFAGSTLTGHQSTVSVQFADGVATVPIILHAARQQSLHFYIDGLLVPDVELTVQPTTHEEHNVTIVQQPRGPINEGGGLLDLQPILQVVDKYGNPLTGEMVKAIQKSNSGDWTLAGNGPVTVDEQGRAAFTSLLATNESTTRDVEEAVIEFVIAGVSVGESAPFRIKKDSGKIITKMRPVPYVVDNPVMDDTGGKFKKIDSNLYITKESHMDLLFELRKPEQVDIYVNGEKQASAKKVDSIFQVVEGNLISFDSVDPLLDIYKLRIRQLPVLRFKDEIRIVAMSSANTDTESIEYVQAPTWIILNTPQLLKVGTKATFTGNTDVAAKLPIGVTTSNGYIESIISHNDGNFSIEFTAPYLPGMMSILVATSGMEQNVETVKNIVIYESLKMVPPYTCEGTVESALTCQLTALGGYGDRTWSIISGDLPSGITLDPRTGLLSGVPESAGTYITVVEVTDRTTEKANRTVTMTIKPKLPQQPAPDREAPQWPDDSELTVSDITQTSVKLSWPTATDNVGVTGYRIYVDGKERTMVSGNVYATTVNDLTANTNYTFKVTAFDAEGNESAALTASIKTLPQPPDPDDEAPQWPEGSKLTISNITQTSVKLSWPSAVNNDKVISYQIAVIGTGGKAVSASEYETSINDLTPDTEYTFQVTAYGLGGNESEPLTAIAKTLPQSPDPDTKAPQWPDDSELTVSDITQTSVKLSWPSATDNVGVAGYRIYVDDFEYKTVDVSENLSIVTGLMAETSYLFKVTAYDEAGNESTALTASAKTLPQSSDPDTEAPQWPDDSKLTVSDITQTSVKLSWPTATDNEGVTGYRIYVDGVERKTVGIGENAIIVTGLAAETSYLFKVTAYDEAGNESTALTASAKTLPQSSDPDTEAPQWPGDSKLSVSDVTQTSVKLSWPRATDSVGVAGYRIYVDGVEYKTVGAGENVTSVTGLAAETSYAFKVTAYDEAGNESAALNESAMTLPKSQDPDPDTEAPQWPYGSELTVSDIKQTSVKLSWPSATDNVEVAGYRIYVNGTEHEMVGYNIHAITIDGLTANTSYTFKVTAYDAVGNVSDALTTSTKTMPQPTEPDTEAPRWPDGSELTVTNVTQTSVKLLWPSVTDNVGVTGYRIYIDEKERKTVSGNVYATTVDSLSANTTYMFKITAYDAEGNESAPLSKQATTARSSSSGGGGGSGGSGSEGGRALSNNADLEELRVYDKDNKKLELSPPFAAGTTSYTLRTQAEEIEIAVKPAHSAAKVMLKDKVMTDRTKVNLEEGDNKLVLIVQAENGSKKVYTLTIRRETPKPSEPAIHFTDLTGHWAESYIKRAAAKGIVSGYPDGAFKPNHPVTRAEFMMMLAGALQLEEEGATLTFSDQDQIGKWAMQSVAKGVQAGIVNGYGDGSFRPNTQITRAEMAVMIARALKLPHKAQIKTGFADDEMIPEWAKGSVEAIRGRGITSGREGKKFVPGDTATRAEAATILLRMLDIQT
ncbi:fibronectin type III domain-containing protein [Brevibacillus borstelensis]|uniref:fibronectin type III domain-containing protein n=1 Tax=Brevibacillus borstelensis TaxID=45462 RepID=UPI0018CC663D|nr:fibronectin type III domain-containing protein [Brevibacillus borstelensis]